ncbi:MAG: hypothetical protein HW421_1728 [Ignavibacteria bacterium]|nr:hypothetical protein [Ignavibacteria bacterium]
MIDLTKIIIDKRKITDYLLKHRPEDDKSEFLNNAGYFLENAEVLLEDIADIIKNNDPIYQSTNQFGALYKIFGELAGPNGRILDIVTVWLQNNQSNITHFVTLYPNKKR